MEKASTPERICKLQGGPTRSLGSDRCALLSCILWKVKWPPVFSRRHIQKWKATVRLTFDCELNVWFDGIKVFVKEVDLAGLDNTEAIIHVR